MAMNTTTHADSPACRSCGGASRRLQRVSRVRPLDYYQCTKCERVWPADKELSAHWRRAWDAREA